jgi:hypothetical protein
MGKKKNKGGKAVVMSLAEFEKDQFSKPSTSADLGSILEGAKTSTQPKKKKEESGGMSSFFEDTDQDFPSYKQKDSFGLDKPLVPKAQINQK